MSPKLKLSRWIHVFKGENNNFALFNSKTLDIFYVNKKTLDLLNMISSGTIVQADKKDISLLLRKNILIEKDVDELKELTVQTDRLINQRKREIGQKLKLNSLRIILTEKCNFGCSYCFVKKRQKTLCGSISWKTLKGGLDLLAKFNKDGHIEIHFFGGEPLIEFNLIKKAVNYITDLIKLKKIKSVFYAITTNATLLDDNKALFFKKYHFLVSISVDGWENLHNKNRKYLDGRDAYKDTIKGLKILQKHKNDIGVLVTPYKNTIKNLAKACEFIINNLNCKYITINSPQPQNGNWEISGKQFSREVKKCMNIAKNTGAMITSLASRILYSLNENLPLVLSCSKFENNYTGTLTASGKISPCIVSWNLGSYLTPAKQFNHFGKFTEWKLMKPYYFKKCTDCPSMNICGGPCPLEIYDMKTSAISKQHERCNFFNDFLKWAVWYKI